MTIDDSLRIIENVIRHQASQMQKEAERQSKEFMEQTKGHLTDREIMLIEQATHSAIGTSLSAAFAGMASIIQQTRSTMQTSAKIIKPGSFS